MIRTDDIGFGGLKILQDPDDFCYGIDAVLLADTAAKAIRARYPASQDRGKGTAQSRIIRAADLGTGNGIVPLILSHKIPGSVITGFEMEIRRAELACRSTEKNGLSERISVINSDILDIGSEYDGKYDIVTMNPPYVKRGSGLRNTDPAKMSARHETTAGIGEFLQTAYRLLKSKGEAVLVHRPSRLADIIYEARRCRLEPKELRMVVPSKGGKANICLVLFSKDGGPQLDILPQLAVRNEDGTYTDEIESIYERL